jgi:hypothetical protein
MTAKLQALFAAGATVRLSADGGIWVGKIASIDDGAIVLADKQGIGATAYLEVRTTEELTIAIDHIAWVLSAVPRA